jgi:hypothetical protein
MAKRTKRDDELSTRPRIHKKLIELFAEVDKGFTDQRQRADDIMDCWEAYECKLGARQMYNGNSKLFVPIIRNAVKARRTRFNNQIFPRTGRFVEVTSENGDIPHATMALIEHYIAACHLQTQIVPPLLTNGDVEGQYTVYCDWNEIARHVVSRETKPLKIGGLDMPEMGEVEEIVEETINDAKPGVEVIHDADFIVLPATVDSIDQALEGGGSVTIARRWTKGKIRQMIDDGEFEEDAGEMVIAALTKRDSPGNTNVPKKLAEMSGIRSGESGKYCQGYETWTKLKIDGEMRLCRAYYGGDDIVLGCKLNPYWCDLCPAISWPVEKDPGVFKGKSLILPGVLDLQVAANDALNEGMDAAAYALMPIIMTDPEKNPRYASMVLDLAAVWETNPNDTKFAQFPPLWRDAFDIIAASRSAIYEALSVNTAIVLQQVRKGAKQNQAEVAQEQQVDILTTAEACVNLEGGILTPLVQRFAWYDMQFREDELLVRSYGEMGQRAKMEEIPPLQFNHRYSLRWFGVEAARNQAQVQQMIAGMNVLRGIPQSEHPGFQRDLSPLIVHLVEQSFGPRLAPLIFKDMKQQLGMDPEIENAMLSERLDVMVHAMDNDPEHIQVHMRLMQDGDPSGSVRSHIERHKLAMQMKNMAAQQAQQGAQGVPGGAGPGVAGTPRIGAQPAGPRQGKAPPGLVRPDQMGRAGAIVPPRRT